jgi:parallel beta-helix repeat protein
LGELYLNAKDTGLALILMLLITIISFPQIEQAKDSHKMRLVLPKFMKICTPHSPIVIMNESDFSDLGFPGNGSLSDPYLIQGLEISATEDCILISDIRANFTIKDCVLTSESHESGYGVLLDNSTSGTIERCTITNKEVGIKLDHADFPSVKDCTINGCRIGVYAFWLFNTNISSNHIYDCSRYGICVSFTLYSEVRNNTVHDNDYCGIALSSTDESIAANNTVYSNLYGSRNMLFDSFGGISLEWCDECVVANNTIINNNEAGIYLYDLYNTSVECNSISEGLTGIWTDRSFSCDMLENNLYNNSISDIFLDESDNCTMIGNSMDWGVRVEGFSWAQWNHTMNANTINDKQLIFLKGLMNDDVDCSSAGQLIIFNNTLLNISNADLSEVCSGIQIGYSTNISARWFTAFNCSKNGILIEKSNNVSLTDIEVVSCTVDGMRISRCQNISLNKCNVTSCADDGIEFEDCKNYLLRNVSAKNNMRTGIRFTESTGDLVSIDNSFENGSVFFDSDSLVSISGKFESSLVNGKEILYMDGDMDINVNGQFYGQVFLRNCTNVCIQQGEFYGIQFASSNKCRIEHLQSISAEVGAHISNSWNCTISHVNLFENHQNGISIHNCVAVKIDSCSVYDNTIWGIDTESSNNSRITNNDIWNQNYGIDLDDCLNSLLSNNTISNCSRGINLFESSNITVVNETVFGCSYQGVRVHRTDFVNISNSLVYNNEWGIEVWQADYSKIIDNQVLANLEVGIYLNQASRYCGVYNNTIGCNENDAYDYGYSNSWDDGSGVGNGWCNYNGSGIYEIAGSASSVDNYPTTISPYLNHGMDIECELGHVGVNVTWVSLCYKYCIILRNGSKVKESTWEGMSITASLDGLGLGVYNYTVRVNGSDGSWFEDTVFVTVQDTTPPRIDSPEDIQYEKGISGNTITWNPVDESPSSYEVYRNETLVNSGQWNGSEIIVNVDGLDIGTYNYSIIVTDTSGQCASDRVIVSVIPVIITTTTTTTTLVTTTTSISTSTTTSSSTQTTTSSIQPLNQIMTVFLIASAVIVIILFGIYYNKRR